MKKFLSKQRLKEVLDSKKIDKKNLLYISKQKLNEDEDESKCTRDLEIKPVISAKDIKKIDRETVGEAACEENIKRVEKNKKVLKKLLNEKEALVISKLAVFGGYSGLACEKLMCISNIERDCLENILNDLKIRDIIINNQNDEKMVKLCKWVQLLLKGITKDRQLNTSEKHLLNVVCMLKYEDNITQKELCKRAGVPASTLSERIIPQLENLNILERVGVGSGKLVRLVI